MGGGLQHEEEGLVEVADGIGEEEVVVWQEDKLLLGLDGVQQSEDEEGNGLSILESILQSLFLVDYILLDGEPNFLNQPFDFGEPVSLLFTSD